MKGYSKVNISYLKRVKWKMKVRTINFLMYIDLCIVERKRSSQIEVDQWSIVLQKAKGDGVKGKGW